MKNLNTTQTKIKSSLLFFALLCAFVFNTRAQTTAWGYGLGGTLNDNGNNITTDASGNVYGTGYYTANSNDFDPGAGTLVLPTFGSFEIYVYKADANGNLLWAKGIGGTGADQGKGIAVDASGNVIVCGNFFGTVDFNPGAGVSNLVSNTNTSDAFVLKLDASGNFLWADAVGGNGSDYAYDVDVDVSGNVYYTGNFAGTVDFDPGVAVANQSVGGNDATFASKLDANGNFGWADVVLGVASNHGNSIKTTGSDVVVGGVFNALCDFDPNGTYYLTPASTGLKPYVWKITQATGALVWAETFGSTATTNDEVRDIDVDAAGNIYTTGYFRSTCDFDPSAGTSNITAATSFSGFIQKLNSSGAFQWAGQFASTNTSGCFSVDVDASNNVLICGNHRGTTDLIIGTDTFNVTCGVIAGGFYVKLNGSGGLLAGGTLTEEATGAAALGIVGSTNGSIVITGYFTYLLDIDPNNAINYISNPDPSYTHIFIMKIDSCFTPEFSISPTTIYTCAGSSATVTLSGSVATNTYQLYKNNIAIGSAVTGTGNAMDFVTNSFNNNDSLTVVATHGACSRTMTGKAYILSGTLAIDSNLLRHYRLDNNFVDEMGGPNASASAGAFGADRFGNANFARIISAANQGVGIPAFITDNVTITFWINPGYVGGGASTDLIFCASYNNSMTSHLNMNGNTLRIGNTGWVATSAGVLQANVWQQVVYVKNGGNVTVYLNGTQILTTSNAPSIATFPINNFGISISGYLGGPIDDIRIYNYGFTATQAVLAYQVPNVWAPVTSITQCLGTPLNIMDSVQLNSGLSYQWFRNGSTIAGATSQLYSDASLAINETGAYRLRGTKGCINALSQNTNVNLSAGGINIANLTAWYKFDNNTADSSGNGNHATASTAVTPTPNRFAQIDKAYSFNGTTSSVTVPATLLGNGQGKSISMWFKRSASGVVQPLVTYQVTVPGAWNPILYIGTDNILRGWIYQGGAAPWTSGITIDTNWHHVAITTTAAAQTAYLDGVQVGYLTGAPNTGTSSLLRIGAGYIGITAGVPVANTYFFNGKIDEVRFYNATLTAANITTIYTGDMGFTSQPQSVSVCTGQSATFTVTISGSVTYQWQFNGSNILGATSAAYNIASVVAGDAGTYVCIVTGNCGATNSSNATLTILSATSIGTQPSATTVCPGSTATFTVVASGAGTLTYQWRKNGTNLTNGGNISGATTATLSVSSVAAGDAGNYSVIVTGTCGSVTSNNAALTLGTATSISTQPNAQTVCNGGTLSLSVIAAGDNLTYQWKKNTVNIGGAISSIYNTPVSLSTAGSYTVLVSGTCGSVTSNAVAVTVNDTITITQQPQASTVCEGSALSISVSATGSSLTYQWRLNGVNISGATSATYSTANALPAMSGSYSVVISSSCGSKTSNAVTITVNPTTAITTQPVTQTACTGSSVTFSVVATGANLTYQWKKNTVDIGGATSASFNIASAVAGDAGSYTVMVTGACGSATSNAATLTIVSSASISQQPTAQTVCVGSPLTISVVGTGGNNTTYQWRKNSVNISGATSATYSVASAQLSDAGSYDVIISGSCGTTTSNAVTVTVNAATVITTQPAATVSVCVGGNISLNVAATGTTITYQWKKNGSNLGGATAAAYSAAVTSNAQAGNYTVDVMSACGTLTSNTSVVTVNDTVIISQQPVGATLCEGSALNLSVTASGTSIAYQWKLNGTNISGATASTYSVASATPAMSGPYTVVITGACGNKISNAATVLINPTTAISTQPISQTACAGSSVTFSVVATGANLTYQWKKNTVNISGATSASFNIASAVAGDAGSYTVVVTGTCGTVTSSAATLTIVTSASISQQPVDVTVCEGSPASFSVVGTGGNNTTYQWQVNGSNISGATGATYSMATVSIALAGSYVCIVSGSCGTVSSSAATLTVHVATASSFSQTICNGSSYLFNGNALTTSGPYNMTLQNANGCDSVITLNLTVLAPITSNISASICAGGSYDFNGTMLSAAGVYLDTIPSAFGCDSMITLTLSIGTTTSISTHPTATTTVCSGDAISLSVTAVGNNLSYQWKKNNVNISGATAATFNIASSLVADAGTYKVDVTGTCGSATSNDAVVNVNATPAPVVQQVGNQLTSSVTGSTYQWYLNGNAIVDSVALSLIATQSGNYKVDVTGANGCTGTSAELTVVISGIENVSSASATIYPNPATELLMIYCDENVVSVEVYNVVGEQVIFQQGEIKQINVSNLANGMYSLKLATKSGSKAVKKFVKE